MHTVTDDFFLDMENNKAGALLLYHILHTPKELIVTVDANFCAMSQPPYLYGCGDGHRITGNSITGLTFAGGELPA